MTATILDGRLVSDSLLNNVSRDVKKLKRAGISPKLVIIFAGDNPASESYIRQKSVASQKTGIVCEVIRLTEKTGTQKLISTIEKLNIDKKVHGILVQLPLPSQINEPLVIRTINPMKDVDGFHAYNLGKMFLSVDSECLVPCTPKGIIKMLEFYKLPIEGKSVVIIGRSNLVGKPLSVMFLNRHATVTVCHSKTHDIKKYTSEADILVSAAGKPLLVKADMVKKGAIIIDVGTTKVKNKLTGDVDFENVKRKAKWITPVPGGVGPMTVVCLMENVVRAAQRLSEK